MMTPYEKGCRAGVWTWEDVCEDGYSSVSACLAGQEQYYQEEMGRLSVFRQRNPAFGAAHEAYLLGWIEATRESLRGLQQNEMPG